MAFALAHALGYGQLHWDASVQAGAIERVATGADAGAASRTPGPVVELNAHVALLPMVRIGAYVAQDLEPLSGAPSREITEAGLRAKLSPPILLAPWRTWAFVGLGYARAYEPSHTLPDLAGFAPGQGGGLLEARAGLGLAYRLQRPWELFLELGGRIGALFLGSMYERGACGCAEPYAGKESFALSLSLGLSLNQ